MADQREEQRQENIEAGGKPCPLEKDGQPCTWVLHPTWEMKTGKNYIYWVDTTVSSKPFTHRHNQGYRGKAKQRPTSELGELMVKAVEGGDRTSATRELIRLAADVAEGGKGHQQMQAIELLGGKLLVAWEKGGKEPCLECAARNSKITLNSGGAVYLRELEVEIIGE